MYKLTVSREDEKVKPKNDDTMLIRFPEQTLHRIQFSVKEKLGMWGLIKRKFKKKLD